MRYFGTTSHRQAYDAPTVTSTHPVVKITRLAQSGVGVRNYKVGFIHA